jgi:chromosomal replication initiation ATPase DnaA
MTPVERACLAGAPHHTPEEPLEDCLVATFVTQVVALGTGVSTHEIAAATRAQFKASQARQITMYLIHVACGWSLRRVAAAFGRDRSTAAHACQRVEDMRDDPAIEALLITCEACVRAAPRPGMAA